MSFSIDIAASVAAGVIAIAANAVTYLAKENFSKKEEKTYGERLKELVGRLSEATQSVDEILNEVSSVARERETAISELEGELKSLEAKEKVLKTRIEALEKTPLPVAEHFAELMKSTETKSAKRDYLLFGAGVIVSTFIGIALKLFGLG